MRYRFVIFVLGLLVCALGGLNGQEIDGIVPDQVRTTATIADQITNPAERKAFLALYDHASPQQELEIAKSFLAAFPQSAFLVQGYEAAARASFDLQDYASGLAYAQEALALLPESPVLLVLVADIEAREHHNAAAMEHSRDAINYLDHFASRASVEKSDWPELKRKLTATANFAMGRAALSEALALTVGTQRARLIATSEDSLAQANQLSPNDQEIAYLLGLAQTASGNLSAAATTFASVYRNKKEYALESLSKLRLIHGRLNPQTDFEVFLKESARETTTVKDHSSAEIELQSAYAGSESCRSCHREIHDSWSQTGMAKMFRPYAAKNVIGDFEKNNRFYFDDGNMGRNGYEKTAAVKRQLFCRMVKREDKYYFDIRQADGSWHSYPVDYTIGSKFQQAYATRLSNGQIHVFPIQYNLLTHRWLNFWKIIDGPESERANLRTWEKLGSATSYQAICAGCHTSQLRNLKGGGFEPDGLQYLEPGINCEMCHGPSLQHVVDTSTGNSYAKRPLESPVSFSSINNRDFVRICAQCHMQSAIHVPNSTGELNYRSDGRFFGKNLQGPFEDFSRKGFYKDGRFRQTTFIGEAIERSQCFKKGDVSCGSCHDPHGHDAASNPSSLKFRDQSDLMCVSCHKSLGSDAAKQEHSHHPVASEASRCVSCHMPRIMNALLFKARTHQIDDIPSAEMTARFGQQESPNACLDCHVKKNTRWLAEQLSTWK